jgi:hypothetical protein
MARILLFIAAVILFFFSISKTQAQTSLPNVVYQSESNPNRTLDKNFKVGSTSFGTIQLCSS